MHLVSLLDEHNANMEREFTLRYINVHVDLKLKRVEVEKLTSKVLEVEKKDTDVALCAKALDDQLTATQNTMSQLEKEIKDLKESHHLE